MMNELYLEDIKNTIKAAKNVDQLKGKTFFIPGANGLIGSFLIDVLMYLNKDGVSITVVANSRSEEKLRKRFGAYLENPNFKYYLGDINDDINYTEHVDYIVNCASNTHPVGYAMDPIGTIMTNIQGTSNLLEFAAKTNAKKTIFTSSVEIYGENIYGIDKFKENQMGYIDCNSLRAGYNESKRCGEALCQAYIEAKGVDVSILRLPRSYGPTIKKDDSKALSQFINNALAHENIVLKSKGEQYFSYLYVADVVSGILRCILAGKNGEVYNLGNEQSDIKLKDLAKTIADIANVEVIFDLPNETEQKGFSKATVARLDYTKAQNELDWEPQYSIRHGVERTIKILTSR